MDEKTIHHLPVLFQEIIDMLNPKTGGRYVDCTLGAGGHAYGILTASSPGGQLLGFDLDADAINLASQRLKEFSDRCILRHESYLSMPATLAELGWDGVDGIVLDFGVSSMQLDRAERGFSFRDDGLLDMRFDPSQGESVAELLLRISQEELADLIWKYGEEPSSRRIAAAICAARNYETIQSTHQLANIIESAVGRSSNRGRRPIHPATRSFQALRIAVNHELEAVETILPLAIQSLYPNGRLAVISFHSLEDRLVKNLFRFESQDCICPPEQPICTCDHHASIRRITHKPVTATRDETLKNPRSRSAKLRVIEKIHQANGINHA